MQRGKSKIGDFTVTLWAVCGRKWGGAVDLKREGSVSNEKKKGAGELAISWEEESRRG